MWERKQCYRETVTCLKSQDTSVTNVFKTRFFVSQSCDLSCRSCCLSINTYFWKYGPSPAGPIQVNLLLKSMELQQNLFWIRHSEVFSSRPPSLRFWVLCPKSWWHHKSQRRRSVLCDVIHFWRSNMDSWECRLFRELVKRWGQLFSPDEQWVGAIGLLSSGPITAHPRRTTTTILTGVDSLNRRPRAELTWRTFLEVFTGPNWAIFPRWCWKICTPVASAVPAISAEDLVHEL